MKKIIVLAATLALVLAATAAMATPFSITYTADNALTDFTYSVNGGAQTPVPGFVDEGAGGDWKNAASLSFNMTPGSTYELTWRVQNYDGAPGSGSSDNPMAFLADVTGLFGYSYTSALWEVAVEDTGAPGAWQAATEYALNSGAWLTGESGNSIWYSANGGAIAGISDDAKWIGFGNYPGPPASDAMYVRLTYTATPLPAAVWMFGAGLVGLFGVGRMRRQS